MISPYEWLLGSIEEGEVIRDIPGDGTVRAQLILAKWPLLPRD